MRRLAAVLGLATCADGVLGIRFPKAWSALWRGVARVCGGPTEQYLAGVVRLTEEYREQSPTGARVLYSLEVAAGLVMLGLTLRRR